MPAPKRPAMNTSTTFTSVCSRFAATTGTESVITRANVVRSKRGVRCGTKRQGTTAAPSSAR